MITLPLRAAFGSGGVPTLALVPCGLYCVTTTGSPAPPAGFCFWICWSFEPCTEGANVPRCGPVGTIRGWSSLGTLSLGIWYGGYLPRGCCGSTVALFRSAELTSPSRGFCRAQQWQRYSQKSKPRRKNAVTSRRKINTPLKKLFMERPHFARRHTARRSRGSLADFPTAGANKKKRNREADTLTLC